MTFDFRYPTPLPSTKGWGPGWPNCQDIARAGDSIFWPGVHRDIAELVSILVAEMKSRGFSFMDPGCWGFGCRATKGASGDVPSFHSWGLAIDINAPENVFGADESTSDIATRNRWVVDLLRDYGFFWLGPSIRDWMHFSFVGSPADAKAMTEKARGLMQDPRVDLLIEGFRARRSGVSKNPDWPALKRLAYEIVDDGLEFPKTAAHAHSDYAPASHAHAPDGHTHPEVEHEHRGTVRVR